MELIELRDIWVVGQHGNPILSGISFKFQFKILRCFGISGRSGSGKTTLAKVIAGLIKPTSGRVLIDSTPLDLLNRLEIAKRIQYVFQNPQEFLDSDFTVRETLMEPVVLHRPKEISKLDELIRTQVGFLFPDVSIMEKKLSYLSEGEIKRVAILRSILLKPELLILDEPTEGIDLINQKTLYHFLKNYLLLRNFNLIVISHNLLLLRALCPTASILFLSEGTLSTR